MRQGTSERKGADGWFKKIDMINSSEIYDTHKDLYLGKKEREKKLL